MQMSKSYLVAVSIELLNTGWCWHVCCKLSSNNINLTLQGWLIVESQGAHCEGWQGLVEILEQCSAVFLVNEGLCLHDEDENDRRGFLMVHDVEV